MTTMAPRGTVDLVAAVRSAIRAGRYAKGRYLPSVRKLAGEHAVSPETVRRGLLVLAKEGLLQVRPRRGFWVSDAGEGAAALGPVAHVTQYAQDLSNAQPVNWALDRALQVAAGRRGWTTLGAHAASMDAGRFREQLATARAWGVVLDTLNPELTARVQAARLPVAMINSWFEGSAFDTVLQDNYLGAFLAAQHLAETGARRVAWINPLRRYCHSRERFAGAVAGLASCGMRFDPHLVVDTDVDTLSDETAQRVHALFKGKQRPDAALLFWKPIAQPVLAIARACGLRPGRELKLVGWTVEELYASEHRPLYAEGPLPPAVVWKAESMAGAALDLLDARRAGKSGEPLRVLVPARLRHANES